MSRDIKFTGYADNPQDIVDAVANVEGSTEECLAWYADGLFTGGARLVLSETEVGQLRYNRACGELPAVFTLNNADGDKNIRIEVWGATTLTAAGAAEFGFGTSSSAPATWYSVTDGAVELTTGTKFLYFRGATGTLTIPKRKLVSYLLISSLGETISFDITGMRLTSMYIGDATEAVYGDITGMPLTYLLYSSSLSSEEGVVGNIAGMPLGTLFIRNSSGIVGNITGNVLDNLLLQNTATSFQYGENTYRISSSAGLQLTGDTAFATAAEYARLIHDAATGTWGAPTYSFTIQSGTVDTDPGWDTVKNDVAILLTKAAWTVIPPCMANSQWRNMASRLASYRTSYGSVRR